VVKAFRPKNAVRAKPASARFDVFSPHPPGGAGRRLKVHFKPGYSPIGTNTTAAILPSSTIDAT
jgi:hypothetical protein